MIVQDPLEVKRKTQSILRVLNDSTEPVGARIIARQLKRFGIDLGERAVRYHLRLMDEKGLTRLVGRDGRTITARGSEDIKNALVTDRIGFVINRIEMLAVRTTFNPTSVSGDIVVNISFFPAGKFKEALKAMGRAFQAGLCVSDLVAVASEGQPLGQIIVPRGKVGLATVCSITINGVLLKAGIPVGSRFGGILEMHKGKPYRFAELIKYEGSTLDPSEIFISGGMTSVSRVAATGEGRLLANFRDMPAQCRDMVRDVMAQLEKCGIRGMVLLGEVSAPVCETPVGLNRVGAVLMGGLNPVAAAVEAGIPVENRPMGGTMDYRDLVRAREL